MQGSQNIEHFKKKKGFDDKAPTKKSSKRRKYAKHVNQAEQHTRGSSKAS